MHKRSAIILTGLLVALVAVIALRLRHHPTQGLQHVPLAVKPVTAKGASSALGNGRAQASVAPAVSRPAVTTPDWSRLPVAIRVICEPEGNGDEEARMVAVHQLGSTLHPDEIQALYWLLRQNYTKSAGLAQEAFGALKNDVLQALLRQEPLPSDLGHVIVGMFREHANDLLWRDYCVQHFALYYGQRWPRSATAPDEVATSETQPAAALRRSPEDPERDEILAAFEEALQEKDNGLAGTALLGLNSLAADGYAEVSKDAVGGLALTMALDEGCGVETRITAVGICGLTGKTEVLPEARILAQTADVLPLRLSSIATIGILGNAQDLELFESLRASSDARLYKALDAALKNLRHRTASGS